MGVSVDFRCLGPRAESSAGGLSGPQEAGPEAQQLLPTMVVEGDLTPYQREKIAAGCASELTIGPYRILDKLGQGGFGQVFKAEHSLMHRVVALKIIVPERTNAEHWLLREIRAATRLTHPNIALAYDANMIDEVLYFAMEFVDGPNLDGLVAERGPLPVPFVWALMRQTALAFQCAHELGIVHRDIKPANLLLVRAAADRLLGNSGTPADLASILVKVVDFGLARCYPKDSPAAHTIEANDGVFGTPAYIAPEQAKNVHDADIRSDLYSLGCSMYFALAGRAPFTGTNMAQVIYQHQHLQPQSLEQIRPDAPAALVAIIKQLMAKNPQHRFQTPKELLETLAYIQVSCVSEVPTPAAESPPTLPDEIAAYSCERKPSAEMASPAKEPAQAEIARPVSKPTKDELAPLWRQWQTVVEALANNRPPRLPAEEYRVLHRTLCLAVRSAREGSDPLRVERLSRLEVLLEPWLSVSILQALDRRTRMDLWQSCRQIERELWPRPPALGMRGLIVAAIGCAVISFLAFFLARFARGW
jgi:eukaryotic-like serine/threonine-protein kinase